MGAQQSSKFLVAVNFANGASADDCKKIFDYFDTDKNGVLDTSESRRFLGELCRHKKLSENVDEFVNQMMERLDTDKDGCLCWGEIISQDFFADEQLGPRMRARSMSDSTRPPKPSPQQTPQTPRGTKVPSFFPTKALPSSPTLTPTNVPPKVPPLPRKSSSPQVSSLSQPSPPKTDSSSPPSPPAPPLILEPKSPTLVADSKPLPPPPSHRHSNSQHLTILDPPDGTRLIRSLSQSEVSIALPPPPPPPSRVTSPQPRTSTPTPALTPTPTFSGSPNASPNVSPASSPVAVALASPVFGSTAFPCNLPSFLTPLSATAPAFSSLSCFSSPVLTAFSANPVTTLSSSSCSSCPPSSRARSPSSKTSSSSASSFSPAPLHRSATISSYSTGPRRMPRPPPHSNTPGANTVNFHRCQRSPQFSAPPPPQPSCFELPPSHYKKRSPPPPPESNPVDVNVKPSAEIPRLDAVLREDALTEREQKLQAAELKFQAAERELHRRERAVEVRERAVEAKEIELQRFEERLTKKGEELRAFVLTPSAAQDTANEIPSYKKMQLTRQKVAQEIMVTEESYVNGLLKLGTHFGSQAQVILLKEDYDTIFGSLAQALPINMALLKDLKERLAHYSDETTIGDLFIKFAPYFKLYAAYIGGHEKALNLISSLLAKNKAFRTVVDKGTKSAGCTLQSCLILPVQRIPRYELLLNEMLKNTPVDHPDRAKLLQALPQIKNAATFLDTSISGADSAAELLAVQHSLVNCPDLLRPGRTLLHRGVLSRIQRGVETKKFELILMTDLIIFTNFHREGLYQRGVGVHRGSLDSYTHRQHSTQHKIKGMIVIDSQFFVQAISSVDLLDEKDEIDVSRSRSRSPHSSMSSPHGGDSDSLRYLLRMVSGSSGQSDWACDSELERTTWLDMLQKAAKFRHQVLDKPPDNLAGGVQLTLVYPADEPHDITLLWLPFEPVEAVGGVLDVRVWWEEATAMVHIMLVEAIDLRTEGDTYVTLSAYTLPEADALAQHLTAHQRAEERGRRTQKPHDAEKKIPPRWTNKSKIVKRAWWGQDFTFSLPASERAGRGRQLLKLEVWEWHQVERDVCLGQLTFDLGTIVSFSSADKAPSAYTSIPEPPSSTSLVRSPSSRALSPVAMKRGVTENREERFRYELRPLASLAGVAGRFFWVTAGTCLLKEEKSFSSGQVVEVIMGSNRVKHETPFSIVLKDVDETSSASSVHRRSGTRQYLMQMCFRTSPAVVDYWCEQLTQVVPLVRVVSRWEEKHSCRMYAPTLWQKGDHCRYCGFSKRSH